MSDCACPSSLQHLPEDLANFYFCSASMFIICFTTALHVLKNWLRWISPIVYKNSRETNGLKNKIHHWGMVNLLKDHFFFLSSQFNIYFITVVTPPPTPTSLCICQDFWQISSLWLGIMKIHHGKKKTIATQKLFQF